ncbi:MAG: NAD(P)H-binding protein [Phyllobacterium sp.]|uniref:NAD(P)H-binding protein n=1 Tax=Phyllobacterium sp. TaxID=1871046 RepID=UPI0030F2F118
MTTFHSSKFPILIIGGTGKTGRRVGERLAARGLPVRIGSRNASQAFDWENPATWAVALEGVSAAYITYYPDLAVPGAAQAVGDVARLAVRKGVKRLVLLSGRGEPEAQRAEQALQASGADWTIVRASWFAENFSESFFRDPILAGELALPVNGVREPFIHADDIADVVVAALTDKRHIGELYEVTGPRLVTFAEATAEIAKATGRDIRFTTVSHDSFMQGPAANDVPADIAALIDELFREVLDGRNEYVTDGVQRALQRAPRDFADFANACAAGGTWEASK